MNTFGSNGSRVAGIGAVTDAHVAALSLERGGVIARHPAVGHQLFVVVSGTAEVSGADAAPVTITAGQAALWEPDESHDTRSVQGMTAFVIEGTLERT
ncbi:hypothetical protein VV01_09770 [Luteipulveratus halotolerans]|uniref:Cupin 2 conserved barrel domain-containing protein n=1 Tax=Luteipulveratus halotolerans TaxID=1631356 RepID=A0A0L6CHU1_9MICO|nr:hypothetical protein VV01_09770 [Luteipulveratus halotolerans]